MAVAALDLILTQEPSLVQAAQDLRYRVFYEELGARADPSTLARRRDEDPFDAVADHLLVVDRDRRVGGRPCVVGCYRLLRQSRAKAVGGLYTAGEFDLDGIVPPCGTIMELGRSCVDPDHRGGAVMGLLWRGIADYVDRHGVGVMLGCASLPGTDPDALAPALAWLHRHALAPAHLRPRALPGRRLPLDRGDLSPERVRAGKAMLPPLLKAYLRMGGMVGDGAVVDHAFNTVDVCVVLPTGAVRARYLHRYGSGAPALEAA